MSDDRHRVLRTVCGRRLPRPDEELVDQGLGFDIGTLLGRRRMLQGLGLAAATVGLAACGAGSTSSGSTAITGTRQPSTSESSSDPEPSESSHRSSLTEIPDETAGPYPGDGSNGPDVLTESGIVRSDIRASFGTAHGKAEGVPMTLDLTIRNLTEGGVPFAGVAVYVWHCDRSGGYSMYSSGLTEENYLRGVQIADANGKVRFTSIFPACYSGRWPHIHFEVYSSVKQITDASTAIATSQVALPADVCTKVYAQSGYDASVRNMAQVSLQQDNVFGNDSGVHQLATVTGNVAKGFLVSLPVGINTRTEPTGGSAPGGPGGGAPPHSGDFPRRGA